LVVVGDADPTILYYIYNILFEISYKNDL